MPRNDAAVDLQFLQRQQLDAQQARDNLNAVQASQINPGVLDAARAQAAGEEPPTAAFSAPEAVATAVGASLILGPVGGLLMGAAQGILGKQAKQNAMDQFAAEQNALTDVTEVINQDFARMRQGAQNQEDLDQINDYQAQTDAAMRLMRSPSERLQGLGEEMFKSTMQQKTAYEERQELQRIEREAQQEQLARELSQEQFTRYSAAQDDYDAQSASYISQVQAFNAVIDALDRGSAADVATALNMFPKLQDPDSAVTDGERQAMAGLASMYDELVQSIAASGGEATLGAGTRAEIQDAAQLLMRSGYRAQVERDIRFSERLVDSEIPPRYHDNFRLSDTVFIAEPIMLRDQDPGPENPTAPSTPPSNPTASSALDSFISSLPGGRTAIDAVSGFFSNALGDGTDERERVRPYNDVQGRIERPTN